MADAREQYAEYLSSPEWLWRREAVLERDGHMCQGCRGAQAVDVHHLTYEHIGNEFLWELVSVCRDCHERYHSVGQRAFTSAGIGAGDPLEPRARGLSKRQRSMLAARRTFG